VESTESLAQSHESLAQKIEIDAEAPLRQFASKNREMQGISTIQGNLVSIAKDFDNAQKKADKLKDKSGRISSDRAANANSSVDDANQQWETQASYVFEQLQTLDEARVNHLRGVLTQFQTHEVDSIEQNRKPAELCLNALLNVETADEIKTFAARISTEPRQTPMQRRRSSASNTVRRLSSAGGSIVPPMPPPPRLTTDRARQSPSFSNEGQGGLGSGANSCLLVWNPANHIAEIKETPKKHGLKSRLGTVMGRRKNAAPPPVPSAEKMKKERNRTSFMPFRRGDSSRSHADTENASVTGRDLTPVVSSEDAKLETPSMQGMEMDRQSSLRTDPEGRQRTPTGSAFVNGTSNTENQSEVASPIAQTPPSNNVVTPPPQVTSFSGIFYGLSAYIYQPLHELSVTPPSPIQHMDPISRAQQEAAATNA
jgi:F-BAR domain only protein